MNQQDKSFMITFTTVISVLVLIAVALFLAARMVSMVSVHPEDSSRKLATIEERIKPVGQVAVVGGPTPPAAKPAAPAAPTQAAAAGPPGESTYKTVCAACHTAGVLGAPKTGNKEDWQPRFAQGLDTLVNHAVNGIRGMPAKGGNPALTEQQIKESTVYMLKESGMAVEAAAPAAAKAEPAAPVAAPAPAPALAGPTQVAGVDLDKGKAVYSSACMACHMTGAAGAPKLGDKTAWEPRAKQGFDTLVSHAANGIRAMPAKGGNPTLSEADIKNSVAYMLRETGIEAASASAAAAPAPAAPPASAPAPAAQPPAVAAATPPAAAPAPASPAADKAEQEKILAAAQKAADAAQQAAKAAQDAAAAAKEATAAAREAATAAREAADAAKAAAARGASPAPHSSAPSGEGAKPAPEAAPPAEQHTPAPDDKPMTEQNAPAPQHHIMTAPINLPASVDLARGKQLYNTVCVICHQTGAAGAPKLSDKAAWAPLLAQGFDALVTSSLDRYKRSAKGGAHLDIADEEIASAVGYMVSRVQ